MSASAQSSSSSSSPLLASIPVLPPLPGYEQSTIEFDGGVIQITFTPIVDTPQPIPSASKLSRDERVWDDVAVREVLRLLALIGPDHHADLIWSMINEFGSGSFTAASINPNVICERIAYFTCNNPDGIDAGIVSSCRNRQQVVESGRIGRVDYRNVLNMLLEPEVLLHVSKMVTSCRCLAKVTKQVTAAAAIEHAKYTALPDRVQHLYAGQSRICVTNNVPSVGQLGVCVGQEVHAIDELLKRIVESSKAAKKITIDYIEFCRRFGALDDGSPWHQLTDAQRELEQRASTHDAQMAAAKRNRIPIPQPAATASSTGSSTVRSTNTATRAANDAMTMQQTMRC